MASNNNNNKVEDDFLYPIPVAGGSTNPFDGLRLTNALDAVLSLYQHAGAIPRQRFNPTAADKKGGNDDSSAPSSPTTGKKGGGDVMSGGGKVVKMDEKIKGNWFKYHERVIPGGVMKLVETITIPTPRGWSTTTAARVNQLFEKRFLIEFESKEVLSMFTYTELDELRFAYTAVYDLITGGSEAISKTQVSVSAASGGASASASSAATASASAATPAASAAPSFFAAQTAQAAANSKVFESMWGLQGLAKRDIKKNCEGSIAGPDGGGASSSSAASSSAAASSSSANPVVVAGKQKAGVAKGGTGSSGLVRTDASKERPKLDAEKKHAKALLEDECKKLWPYSPFAKAAVFTLAQDPNQPRHKPLYKCTVELCNMNKRKVEGPWMGNKKDAEDGAAEVVLKFLYTAAFGKK